MPGPASTTAGGQCMAAPDVCKVPAPPLPPIPTPFPNMGMPAQALPPTCSLKVLMENKFPIVLNSMIPMSAGDEAGIAGGLVSGMIKGPVTYKLGSFKVLIEGKGACTVGAMTSQNGSGPANIPGAQIAPSQMKVMILG